MTSANRRDPYAQNRLWLRGSGEARSALFSSARASPYVLGVKLLGIRASLVESGSQRRVLRRRVHGSASVRRNARIDRAVWHHGPDCGDGRGAHVLAVLMLLKRIVWHPLRSVIDYQLTDYYGIRQILRAFLRTMVARHLARVITLTCPLQHRTAAVPAGSLTGSAAPMRPTHRRGREASGRVRSAHNRPLAGWSETWCA
jgi:hypothetical protein